MLLAAVFILGLFTPSSKNFRRLLQSWKLLYHFSAKKPVVVVLLLLKNPLVNFVIALVNKLFASNCVLGPYPVHGPIPDSGDQVVEWISYNVEHGFQRICLDCHRYLTIFQSQRWVKLSPIHHMWFPLIFLLNSFMSSLN